MDKKPISNRDPGLLSHEDYGNRKLAPADERVLKDMSKGEGIPITSVEQLQALARAAAEVYENAKFRLRKIIRQEHAEEARRIRIDEEFSWRAVAQYCYDHWHKPCDCEGNCWWHPTSNQIIGMAICEIAAEFFNEDYMEAPWS